VYYMKKSLIISALLCLLLGAVLDVASFDPDNSHSLEQLKDYVDQTFQTSYEEISNPGFINIIRDENANIADLNRLEDYIAEFEGKNLKITVKQEGEEIFWTRATGFNDVCLDSTLMGLDVKICQNLFDNEGKLYPFISRQFHRFHQIVLDDQGSDQIDLGNGQMLLTLEKPIRSKWLNFSIIALYLLAIILISIAFLDNLLFLMIGWLIFRLILYFIPLESHFAPMELFSSAHGFSLAHSSVADYLINTLLFLVLSSILCRDIARVKLKANVEGKLKILSLILSGLVLVLVLIYSTKNMIYHADLSFDFDDLSQLRSLEVICLFGLSLNGFSLFGLALILALGISYIIKPDIPWMWLIAFLGGMIVLFDLFSDIRSKNITWLIWWMIVFSGFLAAILYTYNMQLDLKNRASFLKENFHEEDYDQLKLYKDNIASIQASGALDQIINKPADSKYITEDIVEFIKYKSPSLEHIAIDIFPFDALGNPMAANQYDQLKSFEQNLAYNIDLGDKWQFDPLTNKYWYLWDYNRQEQGMIFFGFKKKTDQLDSPKFPVSYIKKGIVVSNQNNLNSEEIKIVSQVSNRNKTFISGPNAYVIYQPKADVILASKKTFASILKPIALFSLIFTILGFIVLVLSWVNGYFSFLPEAIPLKMRNINSFSLRLQLVIIILIIISFVGIAYVTVSFINNFIKNNENQLVESKILAVSKDISLTIRDELNFNTAVQVINGSKSEIESIHQTKLDLYTLSGENTSLQGKLKLDFLPYFYFAKLNQNYPFTIRTKTDDPISYFLLEHHSDHKTIVGIGTNEAVRASKLSLFDFLGSIMNVYVFLFLIAGAIAIAVARSISKPLSVLGDKMKAVKLGTQNERLQWKTDDEIGALIENYNGMVSQLEESAALMARTEREMAWREMAKQVAHEIKNPLTPMKLNIQYLEKAIKSNPEEAKPLIKRISTTLLAQINNLAEIADSFSNVARL